MGRRRPWWALLAATALVMASILAPMEGSAYGINEASDPVDRGLSGDPDSPDDGPARVPPAEATRPEFRFVIVLEAFPGVHVELMVRVPDRFARPLQRMHLR